MDEQITNIDYDLLLDGINTLISKMDEVISLSYSIYHFLAYAVIVSSVGFLVWLLLRPLWEFFKR